MATVRIKEESEFSPRMARVFEGVRKWFRLPFVPAMNRVLAYDEGFWDGFGRCGARAMKPAVLPRRTKELLAVAVSAVNVCEY
ncbi:MAG: carboxymuconolactone decarboxylase family protein [Nitrospinota bacterium]